MRLSTVILLALACSVATAGTKPNFLVIAIDDLYDHHVDSHDFNNLAVPPGDSQIIETLKHLRQQAKGLLP